MNKCKVIFTLALAMAVCCTACSRKPASGQEERTAERFSAEDTEIGYDADAAVCISFDGDRADCKDSGVLISGNTVTVGAGGLYLLTGSGSGQVTVDAKGETVRLVLDSLSLESENSAPLYVKQAEKVIVTLARESQNTLRTTGEYIAIDDNNIDAAIFAKDDLTLNGEGSLTVGSVSGHGIVCKDTLKIAGGNYTVEAASHAVDANDAIEIAGGAFTLGAGKDGLHVENTDDPTLGSMQLNGGTFVLDCADDALHSGSDLTVNGGQFTIATGDDGMHADGALVIHGGEITITDSYEGLEGESVTVTGGEITLRADDDGINAAGGADESGFGGLGRGGERFAADGDCFIEISGGRITVNAAGDGVDSNGSITVSGGTTFIYGPTDSGNGALDYAGACKITGGVFVALGSAGMAMNFGEDSTQGSILVNFSGSAGEELTISSQDGKIIASCVPEKQYQSVLVSCPEITADGSYTIATPSANTDVTMSGLIYSQGGTGGMGGGMMPGDRGFDRGPGGRDKMDQSGNGTGDTPPDPPDGQGGFPGGGNFDPGIGGDMTPPGDGATPETPTGSAI